MAYVALSTFGPRTAHVEVAAALKRLIRRGAKGVVLDLRRNGGGLVSEAQQVASMFLSDGVMGGGKSRSFVICSNSASRPRRSVPQTTASRAAAKSFHRLQGDPARRDSRACRAANGRLVSALVGASGSGNRHTCPGCN